MFCRVDLGIGRIFQTMNTANRQDLLSVSPAWQQSNQKELVHIYLFSTWQYVPGKRLHIIYLLHGSLPPVWDIGLCEVLPKGLSEVWIENGVDERIDCGVEISQPSYEHRHLEHQISLLHPHTSQYHLGRRRSTGATEGEDDVHGEEGKPADHEGHHNHGHRPRRLLLSGTAAVSLLAGTLSRLRLKCLEISLSS